MFFKGPAKIKRIAVPDNFADFSNCKGGIGEQVFGLFHPYIPFKCKR